MQALAKANAGEPRIGQPEPSIEVNSGVTSEKLNISPPCVRTNTSTSFLEANDANVGPISPLNGCHAVAVTMAVWPLTIALTPPVAARRSAMS